MKLPAFIDSHLHVLGIGYYKTIKDLSKYSTIDEMVKDLKGIEQSVLIGQGWNQSQFSENRMPTKDDLNKISSQVPIMLRRVCGHVIVVNDALLDLAGIHTTSKQVDGGAFSYESGIFSENALKLIYNHLPAPTEDDLRQYFILANQALISKGITHVASDDFSSFNVPYEMVIKVLKSLYEEGLMDVRITEQVNLSYENLKDFISKGYVNKEIHPKFKMGPLKILADGSLGGRTAAMLEPYSDALDTYGILAYKDEELFNLVDLANEHGMDSVIHAIGDKTSLQAIQTIIKSIEKQKRFNHHHALIHAQLTPMDQIQMMKTYNIGAIVQPVFINSDINIIEDRLGSRKDTTYLFKSMYDNIPFGFSTDAPIEPINPFYNIYVAMTYKSIKHPDLKSLNPKQTFTLKECLDAYTYKNLDFVYESDLAKDDYIIVDKNIFELSVEEIKDVEILETYIDGVCVYKK
jgi:predicted amidohydrolase YtcJ